MRIVFMGSCPFALACLQPLHHTFRCVSIYTAPPRPKGRGHHVQPTCVQDWAQQQGIPVCTPTSLKTPQAQQELAAWKPDVIVVASYGLLLPPAVLAIPPHGCVNVHPSLLPRWRGASPITSAIAAGDTLTGVCLMLMDAGMDTGPVWHCQEHPISPEDTALTLSQKLAELGARALCQHLPAWVRGECAAVPQSSHGMTLAPKITKEDTTLSWHHHARINALKIRAYPHQVWAHLGKHRVRIIQAKACISPEQHPSEPVRTNESIRHKNEIFQETTTGYPAQTTSPATDKLHPKPLRPENPYYGTNPMVSRINPEQYDKNLNSKIFITEDAKDFFKKQTTVQGSQPAPATSQAFVSDTLHNVVTGDLIVDEKLSSKSGNDTTIVPIKQTTSSVFSSTHSTSSRSLPSQFLTGIQTSEANNTNEKDFYPPLTTRAFHEAHLLFQSHTEPYSPFNHLHTPLQISPSSPCATHSYAHTPHHTPSIPEASPSLGSVVHHPKYGICILCADNTYLAVQLVQTEQGKMMSLQEFCKGRMINIKEK